MRGIEKLQGYSHIIKDWKITNLRYQELLTDDKKCFTYLDPPYEIGSNLYGKKGSMHKGFDHDGFSTICDRFIGPQLISYNSSQLIKDRFKDYQTGEFDLTYTMRSVGEYMREQKERKELLLFNYGIEGLVEQYQSDKEASD
jgi:DNA adenine methylase